MSASNLLRYILFEHVWNIDIIYTMEDSTAPFQDPTGPTSYTQAPKARIAIVPPPKPKLVSTLKGMSHVIFWHLKILNRIGTF